MLIVDRLKKDCLRSVDLRPKNCDREPERYIATNYYKTLYISCGFD